jgi:hypothetical protein
VTKDFRLTRRHLHSGTDSCGGFSSKWVSPQAIQTHSFGTDGQTTRIAFGAREQVTTPALRGDKIRLRRRVPREATGPAVSLVASPRTEGHRLMTAEMTSAKPKDHTDENTTAIICLERKPWSPTVFRGP